MGECSTLHCPLGFKVLPHKPSFLDFRRNCKLSSHIRCTISKHNAKLLLLQSTKSPVLRGNSLNSNCLGSMLDFETAAASDWVPLVDQVLLTASVFLTYVAGVIPNSRSYVNSQKEKSNVMLPSESTMLFEKQDQKSYRCTWDIVKGKLKDSLVVAENGDIVGNSFSVVDEDVVKRPLSLYAIANAPRLRLLMSSIEQLEKEVNAIPNTTEVIERDEWLQVFSTIVKKASQSAFISWMDKEFCKENSKLDKELLTSMSEKLRGDDVILGNVKKSGKLDLYADLMGFLRYGFFRECSYYDHNIYGLHGVAILEDFIINLADAIASMYLELVSLDSNISEKITTSGLSLCTLSTRALQKLRNEVAMCQWINQNFGEIVLMYEDRFDLRVLKMEPYHEPTTKHDENVGWWRVLNLGKSISTDSVLCFAVMRHFSLSLKRTREMRSLKGWRYYFSLMLELSDIAMPLIKAVVAQVRNAITFFLVSLIGRSVGLICNGIRQSLRWKQGDT